MRLYRRKWTHSNHDIGAIHSLPLAEQVLATRGLNAQERAAFLAEEPTELYDPFLLPDMDFACDAIVHALKHRQFILVHGDYDADGVTATSLLTSFLEKAGGLVGWYIPDRLDDGYGLSESGVRYAEAVGAAVVITVDCGITSHEEAKLLAEAGISLIITDHHQCGETLPEALAVINPHRSDSKYPFPDLSGAGVALKLTQALSECLEKSDLWTEGLDLAALGTVADVMPLLDENRSIVKRGLEQINTQPRLGLAALMAAADPRGGAFSSEKISFRLAPALNAAGRMGDSLSATECLLAKDEERAAKKAARLIELNQQRRSVEQDVMQQINALLVQEPERLEHPILIIEGTNWHPGVLGIMAARLSDRLLRPTFVLSCDTDAEGEMYAGSGRAFADFDLYDALSYASDLLEQFGGHRQAAGLTVSGDKLPALQAALDQYAYDQAKIVSFPLIPEEQYDLVVEPTELNVDMVKNLAALEPCGQGNPKPVMRLGPALTAGVRTLGKEDNHLKFRMGDETDGPEVLSFGDGKLISRLDSKTPVTAYGSPGLNVWNGRTAVQLIAKDLTFETDDEEDTRQQGDLDARFSAANDDLSSHELAKLLGLPESELSIGKEALARVYLTLRELLADGYGMLQTGELLPIINAGLRQLISHFQLRRILDIYEEAGLIYISRLSRVIIGVVMLTVKQKVDLYQTPTYRKLYGEGVLLDR